MRLQIKRFAQLSASELYAILQARIDVFVVEQNCAYRDADGLDRDAYHLFYTDDDGAIAAYLRVFYKADAPKTAQIGRVLTIKRGIGLGEKLLRDAARFAKETMRAETLYCEAQTYATGFYRKIGLEIVSELYLEDGIPHVKMMCAL